MNGIGANLVSLCLLIIPYSFNAKDLRLRCAGFSEIESPYPNNSERPAHGHCHLDHCRARACRGALPATLSGLAVDVAGLRDGEYRLHWIDTYTGQTIRTATAEAAGGRLTAECPPLRTDYAVKVLSKMSAESDALQESTR